MKIYDRVSDKKPEVYISKWFNPEESIFGKIFHRKKKKKTIRFNDDLKMGDILFLKDD